MNELFWCFACGKQCEAVEKDIKINKSMTMGIIVCKSCGSEDIEGALICPDCQTVYPESDSHICEPLEVESSC